MPLPEPVFMVILDLKQSCGQCRGSGRQAGIQRLGITQINPAGRCLACQGRGFTLTPLGEELLELLRPFVLEMIRAEAPAPAAAAPSGESE